MSVELLATGESMSYLALRNLRPDLFSPRRTEQFSPDGSLPAVYIGNTYQGDVNVLMGIPVDAIREVRYVRRIDAEFRFARKHPAGALLITLQLR